MCRNGFTSGSSAVACKSMGFAGSAGFSGCATSGLCGAVAPHVADLACAGSESSVLQCPMAVTDDVFCAPEESVVSVVQRCWRSGWQTSVDEQSWQNLEWRSPSAEHFGFATLCCGGDGCFLGCLDSNSCQWHKTKAWRVVSLKLVPGKVA